MPRAVGAPILLLWLRVIGPLRSHYQGLVEPVWDLMGRVVARERALAPAPSVARRFLADREAYGRHVDWVIPGGYYRTTDTPRQAAITLRRLEDALAHYDADRAVEDPACMIPYLLDGDAIRGRVASLSETKVVVKVRAVRRVRHRGRQPGPGDPAGGQAAVVDRDGVGSALAGRVGVAVRGGLAGGPDADRCTDTVAVARQSVRSSRCPLCSPAVRRFRCSRR